MNAGTGHLRDHIAALIALIDEAVYGAMSGPELSAALDGLDSSWVRDLESETVPGLLGSMPGRGTDDSGLSLLTGHLVGPAQDLDPRVTDSLHTLADALAFRQIDLMPLFLAFEKAGPVPPRAGAAGRVAAIAVRGGWITTSLTPGDGEQTDPWFRRLDWAVAAAMTARNATAELLREFPDVPEVGAPPDLAYGTWPPHVGGADHTISLGIALDLLADITGLPIEHRGPDRQFLGQLTDDGQVLPMSRDELLGRAAALGTTARQTIAVTGSTWCRAGSGEGTGDQSFTVLSTGPATLDEAACLLWGEAWRGWKRRRHQAELKRLGWTLVNHGEPPQIPYCVKPAQVVHLLQHFLAPPIPVGNAEEQEPDDKLATVPPQRVAVLGGPAGSGKSVAAHLVARDLSQRSKRPWDVRILSSVDRELPDRHKAAEAGRRAFLAGVTTPDRPRLLVLDGILPIGSGAVGDILLHLARTADCRVLCCLQYDAHSETSWDTDRVSVFPAIVGEAALREFINQLDREYQQIDGQRGHAELIDMARLDLRRLVRLMHREHDEELRSALRDLHGEARTYVLRAAAACLIRGTVSARTGESDEEVFRPFDIICPPDGRPFMVSPGDSRRVLEWALQDRHTAENGQEPPQSPSFGDLCQFIVELSGPQFAGLFQSGDPGVVGQLLCARLYHPRICADLLEQARLTGALERWAARQPATRLAQFLLGLRRTLDASSRQIVQQAFTEHLLYDSTPLPLSDLMLVVRCLRLQLPDLQDRLTLLLDWMYWQVTVLLDERRRGRRDGSADQCLQLMRLVGSFHDSQLNALVTERIVDILGDLDPRRAADYYLVPQVIRVQTRAARNVGNQEVAKHHVLMESDVRRLWDCESPSRAPLHLHMARIMLRNLAHLGTWDAMITEVEEHLPGALALTAVPDLIALLAELRRVGMHCNQILQWADSRSRDGTTYRADFMHGMRSKLRQATPIEAAELLRLVYALHARAASRLVCVREGVPDPDLAKALAVRARSDAKGAGMLLSAAGNVDDLYLRDAPAFATLIAEALGRTWVIDRLRKDMRPAVKYHLVKGIWAAEASFREDCRQAVLDVTTAALREALRPWGPRLAMMIGTDPFLGRSFLGELRQRIDVRDILRGMSAWSSVEVQAEYHRLGRAMFPDLAALFAPQFNLERTAQRLVGVSSAVSVAECTRELHRTLGHQDGTYDGGTLILATNQTPGRNQVWADRLAEIEGGHEFAQVVNVLADVDGAQTREIVRNEFGERRITRSGADEAEPIVYNMTRHMMYDSAGGASAMLAALERHAGLGSAAYLYLRDEDRLMKVITAELQWMQNPVEQCAAVVNLSRAGVHPGQPYTEWINITYNLKRGLVPGFSSPGALLAVLRMMFAWKREWAQDVADQITDDLVARRLSLGRTTDLSPAVHLAAALFTVNEVAGCWSILDALHRLGVPEVVDAIELADSVMLLSLASELRHPAVGDVPQAVNAAVAKGLRQGIVFDDHALWTDIGQACHTLAMQSHEVSATVLQPARRVSQLDVPTLVWGLQRLKSSPWRDDTYGSSLKRLLAAPPLDPAGMVTGLAAAAVAGRLFEVSADDLRAAALRAPFRTLANLCEVAETSPVLHSLMRPLRDDLARRAEEREAWGDWHAKRLSRSLARQVEGFPAVG